MTRTMASPASVERDAALVLCVNDDPSTCYLWRRLLQRAGHRVLEAEGGAEALRLAAEHHPDLALLDIRLPDMLGFEVCRRLKADPETADILVLQSSATLATSGMKVEVFESGADGYLAQPFEGDELVATVRALLRTRDAERRSQHDQDIWHLTFDAMRDGIALLDREGRIERANAALRRVVGRPDEDLRGAPSSALAGWLGLNPSLFGRAVAYASVESEEVEIGKRWYRARIEPLAGYAIDQPSLLLVVSDVDDSRQLMTAHQRRAEALAEMDRRKDEFLAMLAHELRNPLGAISAALHLLDPAPDPRRDRARATIARQLNHLTRLVNDLLDVSRISRGRIELRRETTDLRRLAENAARAVSEHARASGQQLELEVGEEALIASVDPLRIEQVLANLLTNACRYSPSGTVIRLLARRHGDRARLSVLDQGIGIAPEMLDSVFDLFFQVDQSLARSTGGLGIGLTLVRQLVELHGGSVGAASQGLGAGATFDVWLPLDATRAAPAAPPREESSPAEIRPLRLLVIEDNADVREMLATLLESSGHRVYTAGDGISGLDQAIALHPDAALVDIGLPGIDGYQVASNLRARPEGRGIFLIAVTGYGRPEDRSRALDAGFDAWIIKPVDPDELERTLATVVAAEPR